MRKILHLLLLFVFVALPAMADKVSKTEAQQIAQSFMVRQMQHKGKARYAPVPQKMLVGSKVEGDYAPFYVYNVEGDGGFVIVSGNDAVGTILGYSDTGTFDMTNAPSNIVTMMQMFARVVENANERGSARKADAVPSKGKVVVAPLLDEEGILWGQDWPYNQQMPTYTDKEGNVRHYYVGCVATAMAQIMRYYKYPAQGRGTFSYESNLGQTFTADYGSTTYDWSNMPAVADESMPQEQIDQVARLSWQAAVGVSMTLMPSGSGALSQPVVGTLVDHFGYDQGMSYKIREYFSTEQWISMIKKELDAKRPVYYSASNEDGRGGHAYVCDGYDDQDFVHINWGWYGKSNGYFYVNALNPYDLGIGANGGGYNLQQEIIVGIQTPQTPENRRYWDMYCATRFAIVYDASGISCISYIENHTTHDFDGTLALALTDDNGNIKGILGGEPLQIKGVTPMEKPWIGYKAVTFRMSSPLVADGMADGNYRLQFAVQGSGEDYWSLVRTLNTKPDYGMATVKDGVLVNVTQHAPTPDVTLLEKITPDGDVFAQGSARLKVAVRNNSTDFWLSRVWLKFTNVDDPSQSYVLHEDSTITNNVYDGSEKTLYLLVDLPAEMAAGKYKVQAFEKGFQEYPFKEDIAGESIIEVLQQSTGVQVRQVGGFELTSFGANPNEILQGDKVVLTHIVQNYGEECKVSMMIRAVSLDDETKEYDIIRNAEQTIAAGANATVKYAGRIDLMPGKYKIVSYSLVDGIEKLATADADAYIMEVKENNDLTLTCEEISVPTTEMKFDTKYTVKVRVKANKDAKGTLRVRFSPTTRRNGELVIMKRLNQQAGQIIEYSSSFTPSSSKYTPGRYIIYMEYTPEGMSTGKEEGIAGINSQTLFVGITAGIDAPETTADDGITFRGNQITFADVRGISRVELFDVAGQQVFATSVVPTSLTLPVTRGTYIVRIHTAQGIVVRKVMVM